MTQLCSYLSLQKNIKQSSDENVQRLQQHWGTFPNVQGLLRLRKTWAFGTPRFRLSQKATKQLRRPSFGLVECSLLARIAVKKPPFFKKYFLESCYPKHSCGFLAQAKIAIRLLNGRRSSSPD